MIRNLETTDQLIGYSQSVKIEQLLFIVETVIIGGEKLLLFHVFIFIPEKRSRLPAFTSFHSTHVQETFAVARKSTKNMKYFTANNKQ